MHKDRPTGERDTHTHTVTHRCTKTDTQQRDKHKCTEKDTQEPDTHRMTNAQRNHLFSRVKGWSLSGMPEGMAMRWDIPISFSSSVEF